MVTVIFQSLEAIEKGVGVQTKGTLALLWLDVLFCLGLWLCGMYLFW